MPKTHDFLNRRAYEPGGFERLQTLWDAQVRWLATLVRPGVARDLPTDLGELPEDALASLLGLGLAPEPFDRTACIEDESALLAHHALSLWHGHARTKPHESDSERATRASREALAHLGWPPEGALARLLHAALLQGIPAHLR